MPALALKVGLLPLDAGDVTPSTDGSSPYSISAPRTPNGAQYSSAVPLIVYSDDAGYILAESVTIPAYSDRIRYSLDGVTYGAWGVGVTVPSPITPNGSQVFMQCRGITGDPDVYPFTVSIPPGSVWQAFGAAASVALDFALTADASVDSSNSATVALDFAVVGDAVVVANAEASVALDFAVSGDGTSLDVVSGAGAITLDFALEGAAVVGSVAAGQIDLDLAVAGAATAAYTPVEDTNFAASGYTLDTAKFGVVTANSGTGAISDGVGLVLDASGANNRASFVYYKTKMTTATTGTWEWWMTVQDAASDAFEAHFMYSESTSPTASSSSTVVTNRRIYPAGDAFTASSGNLRDYYKNNTPTHTNPWSGTGNTNAKFDTLLGVRFENDAANSRWRVTFLAADESVIHQGSWVAWSATQSVSGDLWTFIGAPSPTPINTNQRKMTVKRFRFYDIVVG